MNGNCGGSATCLWEQMHISLPVVSMMSDTPVYLRSQQMNPIISCVRGCPWGSQALISALRLSSQAGIYALPFQRCLCHSLRSSPFRPNAGFGSPSSALAPCAAGDLQTHQHQHVIVRCLRCPTRSCTASANGETFEAANLWREKPILVVVFRRPGCRACLFAFPSHAFECCGQSLSPSSCLSQSLTPSCAYLGGCVSAPACPVKLCRQCHQSGICDTAHCSDCSILLLHGPLPMTLQMSARA